MSSLESDEAIGNEPVRFLGEPPRDAEGGKIFVQSLNPMTGESEWEMRESDYDYRQEVARAGFADMLHDSERNRMYLDGLRAAVALKRSRGEPVHVLDIGTGTGLLSMMAASLGADSVTAVEEFGPMADCARKTIEKNGFANKIKLVRKRSTGVTVGAGCDMESRANILVTEVFDTELIGEGAIGVFNHAHAELLTNDCLVVPTFGTMYAQLVFSPLAERWNKLKPIKLCSTAQEEALVLNPPSSFGDSSRSLALHDIQMSQFKEEWFEPVTDPVPIFDFDFGSSSSLIPVLEQTAVSAKILRDAADRKRSVDAVFVWWDLKMDPQRKITLSCAPKWAHPDPKDLPWRDHWMQSVYFPLTTVNVDSDCAALTIVSNHDEYSLWFDVTAEADPTKIPTIPMPSPSPGLHLAVSRSRLGQINDAKRNDVLSSAISEAIASVNSQRGVHCLCLSELSLLPLMAAKLGASKVYVLKPSHQMRLVLESFICEDKVLKDRVCFLEADLRDLEKRDLPEQIDLVIGEPNFSSVLLPWHNLRFWLIKDHFGFCASMSSKLCPMGAELWAMPVDFKDLWKIRSPLKQVEGFNMDIFDDIIMDACDACDAVVEPHPLWEYPCVARSAPKMLMRFDFTSPVPDMPVEEGVDFAAEGAVNGIALWMVWRLDSARSLSTGPSESVVVGEEVTWDVHSKQGVHFFVERENVESGNSSIKCRVKFVPLEADIKFSFAKDSES